MAIVALPLLSSPALLLVRKSILVGAKNRMRIPCGTAPSENGGIPACLTFLTDQYLWVLSLWYFLSVSFRVSSRFGSITGSSSCPFCFFFLASCLKLHESPREHWPFEVQWVPSPCVRSWLVSFLLPLGFPLGFPFQAPPRELASLRASKLLSLIFSST